MLVGLWRYDAEKRSIHADATHVITDNERRRMAGRRDRCAIRVDVYVTVAMACSKVRSFQASTAR
jgi:hypothetical protein